MLPRLNMWLNSCQTRASSWMQSPCFSVNYVEILGSVYGMSFRSHGCGVEVLVFQCCAFEEGYCCCSGNLGEWTLRIDLKDLRIVSFHVAILSKGVCILKYAESWLVGVIPSTGSIGSLWSMWCIRRGFLGHERIVLYEFQLAVSCHVVAAG